MPNKSKSSDLTGVSFDHLKGWVVASGVPGWESYTIRFRAARNGPDVTVTALHLDPVDGATDTDLSAYALRSLPIKALAHAALNWDENVYRDALSSLVEEGGEHDPRAATTVQRFAEVWWEGYESGKPPQTYACTVLHLSESTGLRNVRKARKLGLIPETKRSLREDK